MKIGEYQNIAYSLAYVPKYLQLHICIITIICYRFVAATLDSRQRKKGNSGESFFRESTRWKSSPRGLRLARSSSQSLSRTQPCLMSHYTRWAAFEITFLTQKLFPLTKALLTHSYDTFPNSYHHYHSRTPHEETETLTTSRQRAQEFSPSTLCQGSRFFLYIFFYFLFWFWIQEGVSGFLSKLPIIGWELWKNFLGEKIYMSRNRFRTVETVSYVISVWNICTIPLKHSVRWAG